MIHENHIRREELDWKDIGGSPYLMPGERARDTFHMPDNNICPKCGYSKGGNIYRPGRYFRCYKCCTIIEIPDISPMPITPEMLAPEPVHGSLVNAVCEKCGKHFVRKAKNAHTLCQRCRASKQATEWREKYPERYKVIQAAAKRKEREVRRIRREKGVYDA